MQKNLNTKKYIYIGVASAILIGGGTFLTIKNFNSDTKQTIASQKGSFEVTSTVRKTSFKESISASGTVYLEDEVSIYGKEEGLTIGEFLVEEGDFVEEGQAILVYDIEEKKESLEKTIRNLERNLENEKLNLQNMLLPATESEKLNLQNAVIQAERTLIDATNNLNSYETNLAQKNQAVNDAKISMENAEKTYQQNVALYEIEGVTETELNNSKNDYDKAKTNYDKALASLKEFENTKNSLELAVKNAENSLEQSKINLANSEDPLSTEAAKISYKKLLNSIESIEDELDTNKKDLNELPYYAYSTVSGTVTSIPVDEGSKTQDNTAILKVADTSKLIVKASISEYDAPNIAVGQKVEMTTDGIEDKVYYGTITRINSTASSASTNLGSETVVPIEISIENADTLLKSGYTLDLEILTVNEEDSIVINSNAVLTDENTNSNYVFVVKDNKLVKTEVQVGNRDSGKIQIISGLKEGEEIILYPTETTQDGMNLNEFIETIETQGNVNNVKNNSGGTENDSNKEFNKGIQPGGNPGGGPQGNMPRS